MPLYDILNEFQKGSSHMAAIVKARGKGKLPPQMNQGEKCKENKRVDADSQLTTPLLQKQDEMTESVIDIDKPSKPPKINKPSALQYNDVTTNGSVTENIEDCEVIGIITLEDVFEELLQVNYSNLKSCPPPWWLVNIFLPQD
jgi:metal transporter CNNM